MKGTGRPGRVAWLSLLFAGVYGVVLVIAGFLLPVYASSTVSSSGAVTGGSSTLVAVNGPGVIVVLAAPLIVTLAVTCARWQIARRGALTFAWTLTGLLAAVNLLAMLSIGVFLLPVTGALVVACASFRPPSPGAHVIDQPALAG